MSGPFGIADLMGVPPLDTLAWTDLTGGVPVGGDNDFGSLIVYAFAIKFQPIPPYWGYRVGTPNYYLDRLAQASLSFTPPLFGAFTGVIYSEDVHWGDFLRYDPVASAMSGLGTYDFEVHFEPFITGEVFAAVGP